MSSYEINRANTEIFMDLEYEKKNSEACPHTLPISCVYFLTYIERLIDKVIY